MNMLTYQTPFILSQLHIAKNWTEILADIFCIYMPKNITNSLCTLVEDNHGSAHMPSSVLLPY